MEEMQTKFPERLKELRISRGLSQQKIAKEIGVTQTSYFWWEKGKNQPTFENVMKLCVYFDVTSDYLLGLTDV